MTSAEALIAPPNAPRSRMVKALGWLSIVAGALGMPISAISLLMILANSHGTSNSDPVGFVIVVFGPLFAIVIGIGMLRRKRWARYCMLALLAWSVAHNVYRLARGPVPESTYISATGIRTTRLATPVSPLTIPTILVCGVIATTLLSRNVRSEFGPE